MMRGYNLFSTLQNVIKIWKIILFIDLVGESTWADYNRVFLCSSVPETLTERPVHQLTSDAMLMWLDGFQSKNYESSLGPCLPTG